MIRVAAQLHEKVGLSVRRRLHACRGTEPFRLGLYPTDQCRIGAIPFRRRSAHRVEGHQLF